MSDFTFLEEQMLIKDLTEQQKALYQSQMSSVRKEPTTALILAVVLIVDRLYLGDFALGVLKIVTAGGCGIWALIDWFTAQDRAHEYNRKKAQEILAIVRTF